MEDVVCEKTEDMPITSRHFRFFDLPREIRDEIYTQYCTTTPPPTSPLCDYTTIPSPTPLAVSHQFRAELTPIYHRILPQILTQPRVCLPLPLSSPTGHTRYLGWNAWTFHHDTSVRKINIWIRDGVEKGEYAAWWVDAKSLGSLREFSRLNTPLGVEEAVRAFEEFEGVLGGLGKVVTAAGKDRGADGEGKGKEAAARIEAVRGRIRNTLREVGEVLRKEEREERSLWVRCGNERWYGGTP